MKISYKREMKHNYLIIEPDTEVTDSLECRMMLGNMIDGLLRFHIKLVDESQLYYYEITSKQPLDRVLEQHAITARQIRTLITGIDSALSHMETYLLSEDQILMEPQYVYVEPESFSVSLCLVPGQSSCFPKQLSRLLQYLLGKVDHQEQESVVLAYGLYQESLKDNYGIGDLLKWLNREGDRDQSSWEEERGKGYASDCWKGVYEDESRGSGDSGEGRYGNDYYAEGDYEDEALENGNRNKSYKNRRSDGGGQESGFYERKNCENGARNMKTSYNRVPGIEKSEAERETSVQNWIKKNISVSREWMWEAGILLSAVAGVPAGAWLLLGSEAIRKNYMWMAALDVAVSAVLLLFSHKKGMVRKGGGEEFSKTAMEREGVGKRVTYRESRKSDETMDWSMVFKNEDEKQVSPPAAKGQGADTVLLTDLGPEASTPREIRRLASVDKSEQDIKISYYPFIIGKQEGLVDYVLDKGTVSRIHMRIDRIEDHYSITDLNSTNGTYVRGQLLETNETVPVNTGDEVMIANIGYIFT